MNRGASFNFNPEPAATGDSAVAEIVRFRTSAELMSNSPKSHDFGYKRGMKRNAYQPEA